MPDEFKVDIHLAHKTQAKPRIQVTMVFTSWKLTSSPGQMDVRHFIDMSDSAAGLNKKCCM